MLVHCLWVTVKHQEGNLEQELGLPLMGAFWVLSRNRWLLKNARYTLDATRLDRS